MSIKGSIHMRYMMDISNLAENYMPMEADILFPSLILKLAVELRKG